jgi:hypothetical protein
MPVEEFSHLQYNAMPSVEWQQHDELVTTYLNAFSRFIKSIDFQKLQ